MNQRPEGISQEILEAARKAGEKQIADLKGYQAFFEESKLTDPWTCKICEHGNPCSASECIQCNYPRPERLHDQDIEGTNGKDRFKVGIGNIDIAGGEKIISRKI